MEMQMLRKRDLQNQIKEENNYLPRPFLGNGMVAMGYGYPKGFGDGGEEEGRRERKSRIFFGWGKSRWAIRLVLSEVGQGRQGWWVYWCVVNFGAADACAGSSRGREDTGPAFSSTTFGQFGAIIVCSGPVPRRPIPYQETALNVFPMTTNQQ